MRSTRYLALTLLLVVAAGCTVRTAGVHEPLRVGTALPLTGERAQLGLATRSGYEVWQDMVNMGGGLLGRRVDLVARDNRSSPDLVAADYQHLIGRDRRELLLGSFWSLLNLPASAVAERGGGRGGGRHEPARHARRQRGEAVGDQLGPAQAGDVVQHLDLDGALLLGPRQLGGAAGQGERACQLPGRRRRRGPGARPAPG